MSRLVLNVLKILIMRIYYSCGFIRASLYGVKVGYGAKVSPFAKISKAYYVGQATIGRSVSLEKGSYINSGYIHSGIVGRYCSIGYDVCIGPTEHIYSNWTTSPVASKEAGDEVEVDQSDPPIIEDDVWIGAGVIVLRGARIGTGSVIAAGAVVKGRVPEYEIWGGIPARFIKKRFSSNADEVLAREKINQLNIKKCHL